MKSCPKISIITPSFNHGRYIEDTIQSVLNQNYPNYEHIIIDGGSIDNTLDILKKYSNLIWISEKDNGLADAINKGLSLSKGEIIGWINSDDFYVNNIFSFIVDQFQDTSVNWIVGHLVYYNEVTKQTRKSKNIVDITYDRLINNASLVKQPPTFYRKSILDKVNRLNPEYRMVMDYDLFIRLSKVCNPKMVDKYVAFFRLHDDQLTSPKNAYRNTLIQIKEINNVLKKEKINIFKRTTILKPNLVTYVKYLLKRFLFFRENIR